MKFTILIPEKVSLNKIYAGIHFRERASHKEEYQWAVLAAKVPKYEGAFPIAMHYHFRLKGSRLDVSNHAYMLKMVEDGLVACGVLPDDTPEFVGEVRITSEHLAKGGSDEVEVTLKTL